MVRNISYFPGLGDSDHACLCFSMLCYTHLKDTRILRYNTRLVIYDSMYATLEYINWADIMNSMNTLDAWSYLEPFSREN